jgi:dTDP-D-glucose 4,6-dehydratase
LHAEDTARAIIKIVDCDVKNEIYNISGGFEQSNMETVMKILSVLGKHSEELGKYIDLSCSRVGQDLRYSLDDSKLRSLGWSPVKDFDAELPRIVEYYKDRFIW